MRHARADYQRIQDPAGLIPHDEPVFLLRAQDVTAPDAVIAWARLQYADKGNREMAGMAMEHAQRMRDWQKEHGAKVADMNPNAYTRNDGQPRSGMHGLLDTLVESIGYAQAQVAATCAEGHDMTPPDRLTSAIASLAAAIDAVEQRLAAMNTPANAAEGAGMRPPVPGVGAWPGADPDGGVTGPSGIS